MKRAGPLRRRTALRPGGPLVRRTPLKRAAGLKARAIKATQPKRTPEERRARRLVKKRSGGACEIQVPEVCTGRATDWCHRIREGQGGPWSPINGLHGCRACHSWTHEHPAAARVKGWALKTYDPLDTGVCVSGQWVRLTDDGRALPSRPAATMGDPA